MFNNMQKQIDDFKKKSGYDFSVLEVEQIREISEEDSFSGTLLNAIVNSLMAGYAIGHRRAMVEARNKRKASESAATPAEA